MSALPHGPIEVVLVVAAKWNWSAKSFSGVSTHRTACMNWSSTN